MQATATLPATALKFLESLPGLKQHPGGYWTACCPAHNDGTPSLSVQLGDKWLLPKCFVGCSLSDILKAAGCGMGDLALEPRKEQGRWEPPVKRKVIRRYDYRDEQGTPLYRVLRYEPKGFSQECPDPRKPGRWIPGLHPSVRRVLYRLPELHAEPDRWVIVCEGEKDADALAALGFLSTTNVGGSGMGWKDAYSLSLKGRAVCVVPDADPPGLRHADSVVGSLVRCGASRVRLVTLPEGCKDVSEFLERYDGDRAAAVRQLLSVPEWSAKS